ncbi:Exodeoxyribonuclease 7 large subunit [Sterolibacterium denitrificans]|uniref:Exodeoxyribonuclease 7 large subunit n=1 Tax=Sterolibacterium denitrificans TaxID=157592 RepID=A0A7Z7MUT1_9PROT|nr:exodeoxyribonuclease VII large subunit [Sterolibacterium denitrificans]SMB24472.1 Exodeoxyribonuclease 7 large subunit [Sterolibacterium denitrificans]
MFDDVLSVTALNRRARELLQQNFPLLWVAGEISNLTRAASGHVYFSLKDEAAQVRCVMFRSRAQLIPWRLENGQQVEVQASVTLYEARGDFQLNAEGMRRAGLGKLYEAFARLRERLENEGLFTAERKRALPDFPRRIGIVSSPQAAALHDILTTLRRRAPHLPAILYPSPVQGEGAAEKLADAIDTAATRAAADGIDVLIVARGGGSIEDLWAFNEECVARAIAACPLPVISGVGHETDVTIADYVADQRAATPTAAAELVSAGWFDAAARLDALAARLRQHLSRQLEARMQRIDLLGHRLIHPGQRLAHDRQKLALLATRLRAAMRQRQQQHGTRHEHWRLRLARSRPELSDTRRRIEQAAQRLQAGNRNRLTSRRARLATLAASLAALSPQATLARGYSIARDSQGRLVRDSRQLRSGERIALHFASGNAAVRVEDISHGDAN